MRNILITIIVLVIGTGIAHAQDPLAARRLYQEGKKADEMISKGYQCERAASGACFWVKPVKHAHWGDCQMSQGSLKGRMCERVTPTGSQWFFDYERPLVLLQEQIERASGGELHSQDPAVVRLRARFLKLARTIAKKLTHEQQDATADNFSTTLIDAMNDARAAQADQH